MLSLQWIGQSHGRYESGSGINWLSAWISTGRSLAPSGWVCCLWTPRGSAWAWAVTGVGANLALPGHTAPRAWVILCASLGLRQSQYGFLLLIFPGLACPVGKCDLKWSHALQHGTLTACLCKHSQLASAIESGSLLAEVGCPLWEPGGLLEKEVWTTVWHGSEPSRKPIQMVCCFLRAEESLHPWMPSDFLIFMSTTLDFLESRWDAFSCSETWMHLFLVQYCPGR